MLKLKLQYFGHLMQRADSLGKTLMLGKIEGKRRRGIYDGTIPGLSCKYEDNTYCKEVDLLTSTSLCLRFPLEFYRII